ncbi:c-type cytochrome [Pontibacter oryzae]|uniref:Cytochrome c class i n=1 Tax=Pontibacter oryzae TaxID=2304593 RepID=A0A399SEM1_9BACT|nr:c-type cytochrome [Pontibacter oryzae]RIJ42090.1 cytochrome c class i [Pontibacter oryzae]
MLLLRKLSLAVCLATAAFSAQAQDAVAGEKTFKANCTACHSIQADVVGPALKDVHKRRDSAWIRKFVKNSTELIQSGDPVAKEVFEKYGKVQMASFAGQLSDEDIDNVIAYVAQESEKPAEATTTAAGQPSRSETGTTAATDVPFSELPLIVHITLALSGMVVLLVIATVIMLFRLFVPMLDNSIYEEDFRNSFAGRVLFLMRGDATVVTGKAKDEIHSNHDFDGIQEYDNDLPPWWKYMFYASIVFAIAYLLNYHVLHNGALQHEEYEREMQQAALFAASAENDPNAVTNYQVLTGAAALEAGNATFLTNCAACHGQQAQGSVGPNLTDAYWLHGGDVNDIFKTIKFGVPAKGMVPWQGKLSKDQILEVSSYILSLQGSNPPNAKEPQGEKL